jgi:hypothetical protein
VAAACTCTALHHRESCIAYHNYRYQDQGSRHNAVGCSMPILKLCAMQERWHEHGDVMVTLGQAAAATMSNFRMPMTVLSVKRLFQAGGYFHLLIINWQCQWNDFYFNHHGDTTIHHFMETNTVLSWCLGWGNIQIILHSGSNKCYFTVPSTQQ